MGLIERGLNLLFPHRDIIKGGRLYLRRWYLIGGRVTNLDEESPKRWRLCLHKIALSDDDRDAHSHPWRFATLVLRGGYTDERYVQHIDVWGNPVFRTGPYKEDMTAGVSRLREANHYHRVILKDDKPAWTLVLMGPAKQKWGFLLEDGQVKYWRDYLAEKGEDQ